MLYGTADQDPQTEITAQLAQEMYNHDMILLLVTHLDRIDFEVSVVRRHELKTNRRISNRPTNQTDIHLHELAMNRL